MSLSKPTATTAGTNGAALNGGLWAAYQTSLAVSPVRTKAVTSMCVGGLATVLAQLSMGVSPANIQWTAVRNQALIGFIRGPTMHYWMELLNKLFAHLGYHGPVEQSKTPVVVGKMLLDQLLFAPAHMFYYMHAIGFLEGRPAAETAVRVSADFWNIMKLNWKVWPLVSFLNFKLVPAQLRVLSLNVVGLFWMVFLINKIASAAAAAAAAAAALKK